ncbi:MAG TPA: 2-polyprenyl-6-methoxyphenol hydroxylase [Stenotrophomonas sp.]|nr:2-polyprenyl-6-methoxyphenol hydroxylase [Stenotrophomonas sp.]
MPLHIGISGGSVGGLFAATQLARHGHRVTLFERAPHGLEGRGAGLVIQQSVLDLLQREGLQDLGGHGVWAEQRLYLDDRGNVIGREPRRQMQVSWDGLFAAFRRRIDDADYHAGVRVQDIEEDGQQMRVRCSDGSQHRFDLLIGADGQASRVRREVDARQGADGLPRYAGYVAWRGLLAERALPPVAANQLLERMVFHFAPQRQALGYLVPGAQGEVAPGQRRYNWVWYRRLTPAALAQLMADAGREGALSLGPGQIPDVWAARLREDAARWLPPSLAAVVEADARPFMQPIHDYATPRMVHGRVILLGDAAFIARPHTAMGVAKAAADAMALGDALAGIEPAGVTAALLAYERQRLQEGRTIVAYGQRLGESMA